MKKQFKMTIKLSSWIIMALLLLSFQFINSKLSAQEKKRDLSVDDYSLWQTLRLVKISNGGKWVSYNMHYESGMDTLFVQQNRSTKKYVFPLAYEGDFIDSDWFSFLSPKGFHLVNLKTGKQEIILQASKYVYSPIAKRLIILVNEKGKENTLIIRDLIGAVQEQIINVNAFVMDPGGQSLLYSTIEGANQQGIYLLELLGEKKKKRLTTGAVRFTSLSWNNSGKALAFIQNPLDKAGYNSLFYYNLSTKKLYSSDPISLHKSILGDSLLIPSTGYQLDISDDLQRVFFITKKKNITQDTIKGDVEVWNGNAKWIYPMEKKWSTSTVFQVWYPFEDRYQRISNDTLPQFMLTGDQKYAIISNNKQYEPQFEYEGPRDFYLINANDGKSELLLKQHAGNFQYTVPSPTGKYIAYFQEKHWWIYNIEKKTHTNITRNIPYSFIDDENDQPDEVQPFKHLGWSLMDKEILLCDKYDIWKISADGASFERLTKGRETETKFALAGYAFRSTGKRNYDGRIHESVDLNKGFLLETRTVEGHFGYYHWSSKGIRKLVLSTTSRLDQLIQSADAKVFAYTEERFDLPPRLVILGHDEKQGNVLLQSNMQHKQFYWGKSELIEYKNAKGKSLKGLLYYPAQYDASKKYPMIVYIYEQLTNDLHHQYLNPSQIYGDAGFNISNFTTQGYFVLAPDITYQLGDPGMSATDCVVSATKEVLKRGLVKPDKIGLTGHSFGGYETDFIITQTDFFAAALAGSAVTDFTSFYHTVGWDTGKPDIWRFESQQWRMGKSFFDDQEGYRRNSPIEHAKNITTPLLSWSGKEDLWINWNQSVEFYVALRRLGKKNIMLLYPKEGHTLSNRKNLIDLSVRFHEWFDYHLKNAAPAAWIIEGLKANN